MPSLSLTSRLDAVNVILTSIGESPVDSLSGTTADAQSAASVLDELTREVQSEGWHFNTENEVPFTPDGSGNINLPDTILRFEVDRLDRMTVEPVQRGLKLYDRKARSYVFSRPIKASVVYLLPFEELPEAARRYVTVRAARVFHDRFVGSETQHRFTQEDELRARMTLESADLDTSNVNFFSADPAFQRALRR